MLQQSRCWYAQVMLLQALCLWRLPDTVGAHERERHATPGRDGHDGGREPPRALGGATAVQTAERWLSMAGTAHRAPGHPEANGASPRRPLHPFVAEAGTWWPSRWRPGNPSGSSGSTRRASPTTSARAPAPPGVPQAQPVDPALGRLEHPRRARPVPGRRRAGDAEPHRTGRASGRGRGADDPRGAAGDVVTPAVHPQRSPPAAARPAGRHGGPARAGDDLSARLQVPALPLPAQGCVPRGEIREPFCRQQQALLPGRVRRRLPRVLRRKTPHWVSMRVRELDGFWQQMAGRTRS